MENILILGQRRTGSNLLCHAISFFDGYRNINEFYTADSENFFYDLLFSEEEKRVLFDWASRPDKKADKEILLYNIREEPVKAFELLNSIISENKVVKLLEHQLTQANKLYSAIDQFDKFIILERSNTLEQFVSEKIASQYDVWWDINTNDFQIELDVEEYWNYCNVKDLFYQDIRSRLKDKNYITINYEQDLIDGITDSLLTRLQSFLTNSPKIVREDRNRIKRQNTTDVTTKISNWDEVRKYI